MDTLYLEFLFQEGACLEAKIICCVLQQLLKTVDAVGGGGDGEEGDEGAGVMSVHHQRRHEDGEKHNTRRYTAHLQP